MNKEEYRIAKKAIDDHFIPLVEAELTEMKKLIISTSINEASKLGMNGDEYANYLFKSK